MCESKSALIDENCFSVSNTRFRKSVRNIWPKRFFHEFLYWSDCFIFKNWDNQLKLEILQKSSGNQSQVNRHRPKRPWNTVSSPVKTGKWTKILLLWRKWRQLENTVGQIYWEGKGCQTCFRWEMLDFSGSKIMLRVKRLSCLWRIDTQSWPPQLIVSATKNFHCLWEESVYWESTKWREW